MLKQIKDFPNKTTSLDSDFLIMQNPITNETYKITKANLFSASTVNSKICTFLNNGDPNGVLYWLGTQKGLAAWNNPIAAGYLAVTMSSIFNGNVATFGNVSLLGNRVAESGVATANIANQSVRFDLNSQKLICNAYSIRGRNSNTNEIRNWKLQASNDSSTWVDIDSVANTSLANSTWYSKSISGQTIAYRFFRILSTGVDSGGANILAFDEFEIYGTLQG
ncbi:MAG TPA: discoidin domain-containing protein [Nostoc sp.]|uniref:discoidin domain-containing protein n=1 Tax=Nostoc sp. TaxID=1180 RepID=UPI002D2BD83E|nr:discoidin domain-containing protein [Nostoc sp.]HYX18768.1 discoidin domain-containing protein [Nostoc sp.]